jgi:hypothetical protein
MFGEMPSYGFYIRHVKGLEINDVEVSTMTEDLRPAFLLDFVKDVEVRNLRAQHAEGVPTFVLKNVEGFELAHSNGLADLKLDVVEKKSF